MKTWLVIDFEKIRNGRPFMYKVRADSKSEAWTKFAEFAKFKLGIGDGTARTLKALPQDSIDVIDPEEYTVDLR